MRKSSSITFAICLAGLLALAGSDARAGEMYGLPLYPSVSSAPFRGELSANDIPMNALVLSTRDELDKVIAFYEKTLEDRGRKVAKHMFSAKLGYVGYFDKDSGTMRMATVMQGPSGRTMIILSKMDPRPLLFDTAVPSDLPSLPGATGVVKTEGEEAGTSQRTVSYKLKGIQPAQARARLIKAAERLGWKNDENDVSYGREMTVLKKGTEVCVLKIHPEKALNGKVSSNVSMVVFETGNR